MIDSEHKIAPDDGRLWFACHDPLYPRSHETTDVIMKARLASGDPICFGPFDSLDEVLAWARHYELEHHGVVFHQLIDPSSDPLKWFDNERGK